MSDLQRAMVDSDKALAHGSDVNISIAAQRTAQILKNQIIIMRALERLEVRMGAL